MEAQLEWIAKLLASAFEFSDVPVRHHEDQVNADLNRILPWNMSKESGLILEGGNEKSFLLFQAYLRRIEFPIKDYVADSKLVMDQVPRVLNALIETAAHIGSMEQTFAAIRLSQMFSQGCWWNDPPLLQVPQISRKVAESIITEVGETLGGISPLLHLVRLPPSEVSSILEKSGMKPKHILRTVKVIKQLPDVRIVRAKSVSMQGNASTFINGKIEPRKVIRKKVSVCLENVTPSNTRLPFSTSLKTSSSSLWVFLTDGVKELVKFEKCKVSSNRHELEINLDTGDTVPTKAHLIYSNIAGLDTSISIDMS
mmetsp:Transcript_8486/g.9683  ORF Transcript_8486/g.9683 Transcript_8486/m.9683 type:complete len:312 (+) Transcript_8486:3-938(+)